MKVEAIIRIIYNIVLMPLKKLFALCRLHAKFVQIVHASTDFKCYGKKSRIYLKGMLSTNKNVLIEASKGGILEIGDKVYINRNCLIVSHESIKIADGVTIGPNTVIFDHDHNKEGKPVSKPIVIGKNVWIGSNCSILKGVTIGDNSVIGAGSIVTKDVPSNVTFINKLTSTTIER